MVFALILTLLGAPTAELSEAAPGLVEAARAGRWERALEVALRRRDQLPLQPGEALIAARAAREIGDREAELNLLQSVVSDAHLGEVARAELAELVVDDDPGYAVDLIAGMLRRAATSQLRASAVDSAELALENGADRDSRLVVEQQLSGMARGQRRRLELELAITAAPSDRERLRRLLSRSTSDLVAMKAAEKLEASGPTTDEDRWRIAQTYYRHGLFDRAAPIFESLEGAQDPKIPRREVAYLRGRCAFRRGDWATAIRWYETAISRTSSAGRRAELEVHLGRTHELAGDMDAAVAAAQRAVRLDTTDDRRLFLARLRLRRGETDLAAAGLSRLRGRTARARGELMVGLFELSNDATDDAERRLARVSRDPWRGPAAVHGAGLAARRGDWSRTLTILVDAAPALDDYWAGQARVLIAAAPAQEVDDWRRREAVALMDPVDRNRVRALARAIRLEPDAARTEALRRQVARALDLDGGSRPPVFPSGLAGRLWKLGLEESAVRWDPSGFPRQDAAATLWTARREVELGRPWLAIGIADAARRQASWMIPARGMPTDLQRALYPLPFEGEVRRSSERHRVPWSLLAGVAREESRWNPLVVSKVGARGLMQIMPATATATASANGRPEVTPDDLFEPMISLDLGAAELGRLLAVFDGNRAAAVAAYNAGEAQARLWLDQCGPSCGESLYLAQVSFSVTRGYTESVLASAAVYDELYGSDVNERSE
jgi:soluble lytic murein transglycosylase-like protein